MKGDPKEREGRTEEGQRRRRLDGLRGCALASVGRLSDMKG